MGDTIVGRETCCVTEAGDQLQHLAAGKFLKVKKTEVKGHPSAPVLAWSALTDSGCATRLNLNRAVFSLNSVLRTIYPLKLLHLDFELVLRPTY